MWDLLEGSHLFFAKKDRVLDDEQHLAEMVSLLGPPPPEFLKRSDKCAQYWDSQGTALKVPFYPPRENKEKKRKDSIILLRPTYGSNFANAIIGTWKGSVPIPDQSFETREQWLCEEDRALFVRFLRRMLCWMPEERPVAEELAFDEFLMQPYATTFLE